MHSPDRGMGKQFLAIAPQNLFAYLRLELDLYRLKVFQPALRRDNRGVGAEQEAVLRVPTKESGNGDGVDGPFLGVPLSTLLPQDLLENGGAPSTLES